MNTEEQSLTVSQYLHLINETLALIPSEQTFVVGEISDYRVSQGKWVNFDLKDEEEDAKISCFTTTFKFRVPLENGMKVKVIGYPKVYERFGKFSLTVERIELVGEGALQKAYMLLKQKLENEGLFDEARKRALPTFPVRIGLITSTEAAAYGDFLRILNNRWGGVEVLHTPVHVQGKNAVPDILEAFKTLQALPALQAPDVIVLTRGGGSLEDLHAFNDELVARAVFQCSIPVVVGVGHERDESLCDFVADVRASTPSNAAERVVPDRRQVMQEIGHATGRMHDILIASLEHFTRSIDHSVRILDHYIEGRIQDLRLTIERFTHAFERFRLSLIATREYIERNATNITLAFSHVFEAMRDRVHAQTRLLKNFDSQRVLLRGFAIVRSRGRLVTNPAALDQGEGIDVQLAKGSLKARVEKG